MAARSKASRALIKTAVAFAALAVLGFLFIRSVKSTRAEPYGIARQHLRDWTLAVEAAATPSDPVLVLRVSPALAGGLFREVFSRAAESLNSPAVPSIALLLKSEFDSAFAHRTTLDAVVATARAAGLESTLFEPRCMGYRRESARGVNRLLYFVLFDAPAFGRFREQIATGAGSLFDPAALSPVLLIAAADAQFDRWLPLRADPQADCVAPFVTTELTLTVEPR